MANENNKEGNAMFSLITVPAAYIASDQDAQMIARVTEPDDYGTQFFAVMSASGPVPDFWKVEPLAKGMKVNIGGRDPQAPAAEVIRINRKSVTCREDTGETFKVEVIL